jgi:tripartite-type tricarboxylate transporter receptor subunit TctC
MFKAIIVASVMFLVAPSVGRAQAPYYQGKTITIIVGTGAGDLYDLYARAIALYMGRHLPGSPNVIVQNMPGAGHMIAANYIYTVAKPDGLTLGAINAGLYFEQLVGRAEVKFDWPQYTWVGNATKSPQVLYMRADSPFKSIEDVRSAKEPPKCGTTGTGNMGYLVPKLLEETVAAKFNVIPATRAGTKSTLPWNGVRFSAALSAPRRIFPASRFTPGARMGFPESWFKAEERGSRRSPMYRQFTS